MALKKTEVLPDQGGSTPRVKGVADGKAPKVRAAGPCIVGIGASAGGFEAIRKFLRAMPSDSGVAFLVVQHLDPTHVSLAAELFGKFTAMPVSDAVDGAMIKANHVYTAPSDKTLTVQRNRLRLTPRRAMRRAMRRSSVPRL